MCPFKCKWAGAPSPLFRRGRSFKSSCSVLPATHNNLTHWNCQKLSSDRLILLSYAIFNYHIHIYDYSSSTWGQHQWKQTETMVALATLALQSAKELLQKGNLKTKYDALTLSGADVCARNLGIDSSFRIRLWENPALNWPSFVRQSGVKWLAQSYVTLDHKTYFSIFHNWDLWNIWKLNKWAFHLCMVW